MIFWKVILQTWFIVIILSPIISVPPLYVCLCWDLRCVVKANLTCLWQGTCCQGTRSWRWTGTVSLESRVKGSLISDVISFAQPLQYCKWIFIPLLILQSCGCSESSLCNQSHAPSYSQGWGSKVSTYDKMTTSLFYYLLYSNRWWWLVMVKMTQEY